LRITDESSAAVEELSPGSAMLDGALRMSITDADSLARAGVARESAEVVRGAE
jgi:hypothetical protein